MRSLTEQVTFKVSPETLAQLQQQGRTQGLDANPFARKLVEEGLVRNGTENLAAEFRELLAVLRPIADRLASAPVETRAPLPSGNVSPDEFERFGALLQQVEDLLQSQFTGSASVDLDSPQSIKLLANQLVELRADLNKTFAALLHYQFKFSVEDAQHWVDARPIPLDQARATNALHKESIKS